MADLTRLIVSKRPIQLTFGTPNAIQDDFIETLKIAQPTEMVAVPRIYEKMENLVKFKLKTASSMQ